VLLLLALVGLSGPLRAQDTADEPVLERLIPPTDKPPQGEEDQVRTPLERRPQGAETPLSALRTEAPHDPARSELALALARSRVGRTPPPLGGLGLGITGGARMLRPVTWSSWLMDAWWRPRAWFDIGVEGGQTRIAPGDGLDALNWQRAAGIGRLVWAPGAGWELRAGLGVGAAWRDGSAAETAGTPHTAGVLTTGMLTARTPVSSHWGMVLSWRWERGPWRPWYGWETENEGSRAWTMHGLHLGLETAFGRRRLGTGQAARPR
jgi:hypothetical protein